MFEPQALKTAGVLTYSGFSWISVATQNPGKKSQDADASAAS